MTRLSGMKYVQNHHDHHGNQYQKSRTSLTSCSWIYPRKLWLYLTGVVLPHSIPILNDEIELFMIGIICYTIFGKTNTSNFNILIVSLFLMHYYRGLRWQLGFIYIVLLLLLIIPYNPWYSKIIRAIFMVLSLLLCLIFPMLPPVLADIEDQHLLNVGVQDIVLFLDNEENLKEPNKQQEEVVREGNENQAQQQQPQQQQQFQQKDRAESSSLSQSESNPQGFIVRAYYPIDPSHHDTSRRKSFWKDSILYTLLAIFILNMAVIIHPITTITTDKMMILPTPAIITTVINNIITMMNFNFDNNNNNNNNNHSKMKLDHDNPPHHHHDNINTNLDIILSWLLFLLSYILHKLLEIQSNVKLSPFVPEGNDVIKEMAKFAEIPSIVFSHMNLMKIHCEEDAPISNHAKRVLLFYPGLGGLRTSQVSLCMKAACEGYFVLCLESSDRTPSAIVLPPHNMKQAYQSFDDYKLQRKLKKQQQQRQRQEGKTHTSQINGSSSSSVSTHETTTTNFINTVSTTTTTSKDTDTTSNNPKTNTIVDDDDDDDDTTLGHEFRYNQMMIRTRESIKVMQFLQKYSGNRSDSNSSSSKSSGNGNTSNNSSNFNHNNNTTTTTTTIGKKAVDDVYLGYVRGNNSSSPRKGDRLCWTRDVGGSLFWQSLQNHFFDTISIDTSAGSNTNSACNGNGNATATTISSGSNSSANKAHDDHHQQQQQNHNDNKNQISPFLMGHSFGGATVLHLIADECIEAISFRTSYPISGCVIHDPWTVIPLSDQVKNMSNSSISIPTLILQAELFHYFYEYNILHACQKVIFAKINDAGHHSFNDMGLLSPIVQRLLKNIGQQDPVVLNRCINNVSIQFLNQIRLATGIVNTTTTIASSTSDVNANTAGTALKSSSAITNHTTGDSMILNHDEPKIITTTTLTQEAAPAVASPAPVIQQKQQCVVEGIDFQPVIEMLKQYSGFNIITCRV